MFKLAVDVALECISSSSSDNASGDDGDCPASLLPLQRYIYSSRCTIFSPKLATDKQIFVPRILIGKG